jgi:glycosyltransferase involved in cell wall biosynthesis
MKITFYSNFLNHHQLPFCKEMYECIGEDFKFVATEPVPEERLNMGYHDMSTQYPFALNTYSSKKAYEEAIKLGNESDVVIIGSASKLFIENRLKANKLTFYYMERIFKKGRHRILNPKTLSYLLLNHSRHRSKNLYILCASAYTSADFSLVRAYRNKAYKWGYFPEVKKHDLNELMSLKKQNKIPKLLWVGRFLDRKHPDDAVKLGKMLKDNGYKFDLDIIGTGPMASQIKNMIVSNNLQNEVKLLGSMKPEQVREHMEKANIFLFTSDFNEGWGAVLNESMNSGCGIVASHAIGSVPFLLKNKINGLIYKNGDINHLYQNVKYLLDNEKGCYQMGINAYNTLHESWNAKEAAKRVIKLSEGLLNGNVPVFKDGPCSIAENISQKYKY